MTPTQAVEALVRAVGRLTDTTVALPDDAMDRPWAWGAYDEEGLRFALLLTQHELRDLAVRLHAARDRQGKPIGESERIRAQYHDSYRDLTGLLASVRDDELDRAPGEDQWPVREAVKHMIGALYGFSAVLQLAREAYARGEPQAEPSDEAFARAKALPDEPEGSVTGDRGAVLNALFNAHRRALDEMSAVLDGDLQRPALFWDGHMPFRFRLHRFEAHVRQHTVQLEKTLLAIGHPPTEAERLVRLVHRALGDVESADRDGTGDELIATAAVAIDDRTAGLAGSAELRKSD